MQHLETLLAHYGWEGTTLVALLLAMWFVQLRYYLFVYGPVASYRNNRRPTVREAEPPVSVVVPMFSEDYAFVEERLTVQIRDCIQEALDPMGVAVVIEASHMCMRMRGVEKQESATTTSAFTGVFLTSQRTREEFMTLISHQYR